LVAPPVNHFLYVYQQIYQFSLEGTKCPDAPISITPGQDPSVVFRSPFGETEVSITGEIKSTLNVTGNRRVGLGHLLSPPTLFVLVSEAKRVTGALDFTLEEDREITTSRTLKPLPTESVFEIAVAVVATAFIVEGAPVVAVQAAVLALMVLASGDGDVSLLEGTETASASDVRVASAVVDRAGPPSPNVIADLSLAFGPEFIAFSTVQALMVDDDLKRPGQEISFTASGFVPHSRAYLYLGFPGEPSPARQDEVLADANGVISGKVRLPEPAQSGQWLIAVIDRQALINMLNDFGHGRTTSLHFYMAANSVTVSPAAAIVPRNLVKVEKSVNPTSVAPGAVVTFTVTITLGSGRNGLTLDDTLGNAGQAPDTQLVIGSPLLNGSPLGTTPTLVFNQPNRVIYRFQLGDLPSGVHTLTYQVQLSPKLGCFATVSNGANLDQDGVIGHIATDTISFSVRGCITPTATRAPTGTGTPTLTGNR
jgi:hypothetical protein